jgi:predicted nucleic acid-binding protein
MPDRVFIDTNVLIYAHDVDALRKHEIASEILRELWSTRRGVLSTQVLQEFYVNVTQKIPAPLPRSLARQIVRQYFVWHVELLPPALILKASDIEERHQLSFWDALILSAAAEAGATKLLTEDLNPGQTIEGVLIENPFAPVPG